MLYQLTFHERQPLVTKPMQTYPIKDRRQSPSSSPLSYKTSRQNHASSKATLVLYSNNYETIEYEDRNSSLDVKV
ncbi:hypothetical protein [Halalkalibacter krulwichiae]|uniref:Uncharacterized protein n=1 Tax=Halalkalibacter krulwichiae TaxID=199441 RepID=A0A1X9M9L4_9BACI|nr:hypothetical protein [Halalkalibacter krulwichiae]ARK28863.1 hypothetical protein BkAM31D_02765 [Halalkalibacter krulwichiae]